MNTALTYHLNDYLGIDVSIDPASATTLMQQAMQAQEWLRATYLPEWLELLGGLVVCDYPLARSNAAALRGVCDMRSTIEQATDIAQLEFALANIERNVRTIATSTKLPRDRAMQWGIWARDVPMAIAHGLAEQPFLDAGVCKAIAGCCMYCAYVTSQIVTDDGVAEEIAMRMFEVMPRELLALLSSAPPAPEA